jgi:hypothetical protein
MFELAEKLLEVNDDEIVKVGVEVTETDPTVVEVLLEDKNIDLETEELELLYSDP